MVIVPATTGHMAVLPRHVPTIAELKPDVLSVHEVKDVTKYLLSSATNYVADIITVEAVPLRPHRVWLSSPKSLAQPLLIWRKLKPK